MIDTNARKISDILRRGVEEVIVSESLEKKLKSGVKLKIYFGVDPTGSKLHLGHAVVLRKLKEFSDLGHQVILLIGDFTARIGDPTGRDALRIPLTDAKIKENMRDYKRQASTILNFSKVKIQYNSSWLAKLKFKDILDLAGHFTVQQMLQREMFDKRIKDNQPISIQEFIYPLMQGYDSVAMDVDLEIGGNDQMFNMLTGRALQKIYNNKDKDILTLRLLLGTDGRKMSKTYNNAIYLDDVPSEMYGKVMSIKDELISDYAELCVPREVSVSEIINPRDKKAKLAKAIVELYHGNEEAKKAEEEFNKIFKSKELPQDMPLFKTEKRNYFVLDLLFDTKLASSKNEAKRLVEGGGVEINHNGKQERVLDWKTELALEDNMVLKVGSRKFVKIKLI